MSISDLKNKVFISTQPEDGFHELEELFSDTGAKVLNFPMIKTAEAAFSAQQEELLKNIGSFDWLVFTSKSGVRFFLHKYQEINGEPFVAENTRIAVIGGRTGNELLRHKVKPDYVSNSSTAEVFAKELADKIIPEGSRVLLLLGNLAGDVLENTLNPRAKVQRIDCYNTVKPETLDTELFRIIAENEYELIICTSTSSFKNFCEEMISLNLEPHNLRFVSIGKSTTTSMNNVGIFPVLTANTSNLQGIVNEIKEFYHNKSQCHEL